MKALRSGMWLTVLVMLYFPCVWFMGVKQRRKD
jgi:hypothetical protein